MKRQDLEFYTLLILGIIWLIDYQMLNGTINNRDESYFFNETMHYAYLTDLGILYLIITLLIILTIILLRKFKPLKRK